MNSSNKCLASLGKPSSLSEMYLAIESEKKRKNEVANKVMAAKGLTKEEKQEIYLLLTNDEPPIIKKGRPPKTKRDMDFAFDYLETKYCKKWTGIKAIAKKYAMENSDETAIYKALGRGLKALEVDLKDDEHSIKYTLEFWKESSPLYPRIMYFKAVTEYKLSLLNYHKLSKESEKMTGKNDGQINSLE